MTEEIINISHLAKEYISNKNKLEILNDINIKIKSRDVISISGPSGSGKSTFLNILGLLDSEFSGEYNFLTRSVKSITNDNKNLLRNNSIGFVHQFFHLIPELSVWENVALPSLIKTNNFSMSMIEAKSIITKFELIDRINAKPLNLSGGEQQRIAIARALINKPKIVIADEMTGNLDEKTADVIFSFFLDQVKNNNQTLIYVTHNKKYALQANIKYEISKQSLTRI